MAKYFAEEFAYNCRYESSLGCIKLLEATQYKYINVVLEYDETPILAALWADLPRVAKLLYDNKCDLTVVDRFGFNVLISASRSNYKFVKILLENKKIIDINAKNTKNQSALDIALYYDKLDIALLLAKYGIDINYNISIINTPACIQFKRIMYNKYKKLVIAEIDDPLSVIYRSFRTTYAVQLVNMICDFII
jgi:ankyrin repeat protein